MSDSTVAIHVRTYSLSPKEVLIPAGPRSESKADFTVLNIATESADAASKNIVARKDVIAPPMMARGAQQLAKMPKIGVRKVRMNASKYAPPRNFDAEPYDDIAFVKVDVNEPCKPVLSSFRSVRGSKWNPNWGFEQTVDMLLSAQYERRDIV